jgi:hypothetical protein
MMAKPFNCYGGPIETPNIDRIAGQGVRYSSRGIWHEGWKAVTTHPCIAGWGHFYDAHARVGLE